MRVTGKNLLLVVPSVTSFLTFLPAVAEEWRRRGGIVAVAAGPAMAGHDETGNGGSWPLGVGRLALPAFRAGAPTALLAAARQLTRHVERWRPDIVHAHFTAGVCLAAMARRWSSHGRITWIGTFHGLHPAAGSGPGSALIAAIERWAARRMSLVSVLNAEDRSDLRDRIGGVPVHVHRSFGMGCDLDRFDATRFSVADRLARRRAARLACDTFVLAFVGRQTDFKGFAATVRGYRLLRDSGLDAALVVVGSADAVHRCGLTANERRMLDQDPRVIRTGWQSDVASWLAIADACVLPSIREGMPVSLMESLAMGVPVITVDSRGCRDVVRDGVDGFVLPSPAPADIARAVSALATQPPLREAMRAAAIAGRGRFDRRAHAVEQVDMYASLAGPHAAPDTGAAPAFSPDRSQTTS